ncbi:MAG: hypothetical protein JRG91_04525 [Deltaproteobacteria bacterium]|nr:hypothetical protein [Deltaproteobacteria bacterium]
MGKFYWIGIGLFFVGAALEVLPTGDYRFYTSLAGLAVLLAAMSCMFVEFLRMKRSRGLKLTRKNKILFIAGVVAFVVGIFLGFLLAVRWSAGS